MRAAIYARISNDKEGAGLGVARQEADCREVCDRLRWTVTEVYADNDRSAYSGKRRPDYERLLNAARAKRIDAIVAWHTDRLHRSPRELETFIEVVEAASIQIQTVRAGIIDLSTPAGRMIARQLGAVARYESEHKSDRQKAKALELARAGQPSGGGDRPFGFEVDGKTIRLSEAVLIREIADRLLAGESLRGMCVDLNKRGIPTPTGGTWKQTPLRRMIANPRLSGQRVHHGEVIGKAVWPAIITPAQTARLAALFADPSRQMTRAPRRYLLKGLVRCWRCGAVLVGRPRENGQRRYVCATGPNFLGCGAVFTLAEPLEEFVTGAVLRALDSKEFADAIRGRPVGIQPADRLQHRAEELTLQLDDLATGYAQKHFTMREWLTARDLVQTELEDVRRRLIADQSAIASARYLGQGHELAQRWDDLGIDRQATIINAVVSSVTVGPGRRGYNRFDPPRFTIEYRH